jgi:hypothetical protein
LHIEDTRLDRTAIFIAHDKFRGQAWYDPPQNREAGMSIRSAFLTILMVLVGFASLPAQGIPPYPNAITNRLFYHKTPMAPPAVNTVFADPDLGASMVRVTDQSTDPNGGDDFFHNPSTGPSPTATFRWMDVSLALPRAGMAKSEPPKRTGIRVPISWMVKLD